MSLDDYIDRIREQRGDKPGAAKPSFLVFTTGAKEFFSGEVVDISSRETILLRRPTARRS